MGYLPIIEEGLKGTVSEGKLKLLLEDIGPKAGLTVAANLGRINGLRRVAEALNTGQKFTDRQVRQLAGLSPEEEEKPTPIPRGRLERVAPGTKPSPEILKFVSAQERGNVDAALRKLRAKGYDVGE